MTRITSIEDLRQRFGRRVPRMFRDYVEAGSWTESTLRDNESAFDKIKLRQKVLVDMTNRSLKTHMAGQPVAMPVALAPIGLTGMVQPDGEIKAAQAAEQFGVPYCLSTMSICSIEDVAERTTAPFWFQLYVMKDRNFIGGLIERAKAAGCSALVLTVDLQILGDRLVDIKNGLSTPPNPTLKNLLNIASKPHWALAMARTRRRSFGNILGHLENVQKTRSLARWTAQQFDPKLNWDDVQWIRDRWGGTLILKGIIDADDARMAAKSGADALIVSNHGGRQLDGAPAAIDALPGIVSAVGDDIEVWMDGGIRTGQDLFRALALGAKGTMIGRAYVYGLGALGAEGVSKALQILQRELDLTMAFCGLRDINDVSEQVIWNG